MEDTGRSSMLSVRVTALEKQALRLRSKEEQISESELAHRMLRRGNLEQLVAFYFGDDSSEKTRVLDNDDER